MSSTQFSTLASFYDELMDVVPYSFWADYVMTLFEFAGHHPRQVLDCACGTGNLSFELAHQGLKVTGIDLSATMIEEARKKVMATEIEFHVGDLSQFDLKQKFDSVTCLYDSLNYIIDADKLLKAFAQIRHHTMDDGIFIFDLNSEWAFEANLFTQSCRKPQKSLHYEWRANFNPETKICQVDMKFLKQLPDGREIQFKEQHHERAYTQREIQEMLQATGWQLLHTFDAYTLNRPHHRSERWFFVARAI